MSDTAPDSLPAVMEVMSGITIPEWFAMQCTRCGTMFAVDPQRTMEAKAELFKMGHGPDARCAR